MLEAVQLAAVMLDLDGRILFCNEYLARLSGWSREELEGRDWFETLLPESLRDASRATYLERTTQGNLEAHFERPLVTRSGQIRHLAWDATQIRDAQGRVVAVARLGRDVTELRSLEEQYRQAQKMEAVGQLAGGVAHDFNNILQVILGYVDLAQHGLARGREPYQELDQIAAASSRATTLVRQLLTFSRRQQLRPQRLDLDEVITALTRMLRRVLGENIELLVEGRFGLPPVWGDPGSIEQVLLNLCVNARDAMPDGGTIRVTTAAVTLGPDVAIRFPWAAPGPFVLIAVADTGVGMPPEVMEHLFEPFFTTKEVGKGTGLGLATVYGIVRQHGGVVEVSSAPGEGSTFRVYLPLAAAAERPNRAVEAEPAMAHARGETILVAEDDDQVRALAVEILTRAGYRVLAARDGSEALALFDRERGRVDLLLLDALMPNVNGPEVWAAVRALRPEARALFCTGYSASGLLPEILDRGQAGVLEKPYTGAELLRRVRGLLQG
jgi:PAS domain S-box-containing protein